MIRDERRPSRPTVDRPSWVCPGCGVCYDGRPEIVTEEPLECYCSTECYAENTEETTNE